MQDCIESIEFVKKTKTNIENKCECLAFCDENVYKKTLCNALCMLTSLKKITQTPRYVIPLFGKRNCL